MLEVRCSGTPYEIGHQHGSLARDKVNGSLKFYRELFETKCDMDWPAVRAEASKYLDSLSKINIVALNVRTEITFGLFTDKPARPVPVDGCTSLGYHPADGASFLMQNWDWQPEQASNLFVCHVSQPGTDIPRFSMVTEGGVIGKIGLNEHGVGTCLNAIRAKGVDPSRLPIHLALRTALESPSKMVAIARLEAKGLAGSGHILISDPTDGPTGLECTTIGIKKLEKDKNGLVVHANNLILDHPGIDEPPWLDDSPVRTSRLQKLAEEHVVAAEKTDFPSWFELFQDSDGYPCGINRCKAPGSEAQTLFNIVMDLAKKQATVTFGRPTEYTERVGIAF
ncbi:AAT-domain-containing protein [Thozetella sp. PMI_491]|nr:AAT-domain-containing protein [Thozetella sp. PMI_491]